MFMGVSVGVSVLVGMDVLFFHRSSPRQMATMELDAPILHLPPYSGALPLPS